MSQIRQRADTVAIRTSQIANRNSHIRQRADTVAIRTSASGRTQSQLANLKSSLLTPGAAAAAGSINRAATGIGAAGAGNSSLPHLPVMTHMGLRKLSLRLDKDGNSQPCQ